MGGLFQQKTLGRAPPLSARNRTAVTAIIVLKLTSTRWVANVPALSPRKRSILQQTKLSAVPYRRRSSDPCGRQGQRQVVARRYPDRPTQYKYE